MCLCQATHGRVPPQDITQALHFLAPAICPETPFPPPHINLRASLSPSLSPSFSVSCRCCCCLYKSSRRVVPSGATEDSPGFRQSRRWFHGFPWGNCFGCSTPPPSHAVMGQPGESRKPPLPKTSEDSASSSTEFDVESRGEWVSQAHSKWLALPTVLQSSPAGLCP